ncbi:MAG: nucleoside monophosphate kinase, partial [Deltaproteobacteria bacterium]|nr:nucleoside monophosphate kinase [Deltaproteobacteria bacterium]
MSERPNVVVTGKSGAGKQPRIDVLVEHYGLAQLSTGNLFRAYLGTWREVGSTDVQDLFDGAAFAPDAMLAARIAPAARATGVDPEAAILGFRASCYVDRGLFVPDDITNALLASAFRAAGGHGLALDGYPRTPDQSEFLLDLAAQSGARIDLVLVVDHDDEAIVARTMGRRICPNKACGKVFHLVHKPPRDGRFCTACGAEVIQRSDDTEPRIRTRLAEFQAKALPAIRHLEATGIPLVTVPGALPVFTDEAVRASVLGAVRPILG